MGAEALFIMSKTLSKITLKKNKIVFIMFHINILITISINIFKFTFTTKASVIPTTE